MKTKIFLYFFLCFIFGCGLAAGKSTVSNNLGGIKSAPHFPSNGGNIQAGIGYSDDAQQVALQPCFNATIGSYGVREGIVKLSTALFFSQITNDLKIDVTSSAKIGKFSGDAEANYFKSIEDEDYSFSLNYYQYFNNNPGIVVHGTGLDALSADGKATYSDGKNPYFGLICGDEYFTSFKQGAELIMGLNLRFASKAQKEEFKVHAGASFGNIFSAAGDIQRIANQYNISGGVDIQAYQKGGDPVRLSKILSKDPSGAYYALTCDIKHMDNCIKAASGLLDYASTDFPAQFSVDEQKGLVPLGIGFSELRPIEFLGLKPAESLLTPQILQERAALSTELDKYNYYRQKLYELMSGYPVAWDTGSGTYKTAQALYDRSVDNIGRVLSSDNPKYGARYCFDVPYKCDAVYNYIESQIKPITEADLKFMTPIKYYYVSNQANYYHNGAGWSFIVNPNCSDVINRIEDVDFNDTNAHFTAYAHSIGPGGDHRWWTFYYWNGVLQPDGKTVHFLSRRSEGISNDQDFDKDLSPLYFTVYQPTE